MVDLEALLLRDYDLHGRKSRYKAVVCFCHLRSHFSEIHIDRAFTETLDYVLARRSEGAAAATIHLELGMLGRALTLAAQHGLIPTRPLLAKPTVQNTREGFLSIGQLDQLLARLEQPVRDATLFAYVTGWRRGEVFGLTWDRVDLDSQTVRLAPGSTKNRDGRTIPYGVHPGLRGVVRRRLEDARGPYVFHRLGRPVKSFRRQWKTACLAVGVGSTVFHDLRRSAVRNMEQAGVPRSVAMQITGHRTESIYRRYAITNHADLSRGIGLIAQLSRGRRGTKEESGSGGVGQAQQEEVVSQAPEGNRFDGRPGVSQKDG